MKKIPVFLAFDSKLKNHYKHVFNSVIANSSIEIEPHIICEQGVDIEPYDNLIIHKIEPDVTQYFQYGIIKSRAMFFRWMIPDLTMAKRAIYLDNDLIVLGDVRELAELDMGNYLLAAVPNYFQHKVKQTFFMQGQCPIGGEKKAFLSGQLVINCKQWRQERIGKALNDFVKKYGVLDEAALNIVCGDRIMELDKYWCLPANRVSKEYQHHKLLYEYDMKKAKLLHYSGKNKPWRGKCRNQEYYKKYL